MLPLDELEERMTLTSGTFGRMIGVKYAEGFVVKEIIQCRRRGENACEVDLKRVRTGRRSKTRPIPARS